MHRYPFNPVVAFTLCLGTPVARSDPQASKAPEASVGTIRYVANMGLLLTAGETSVLIDALFRQGEPAYDNVDAQTRELMELGRPPFDKVVMALATHVHKDHFDPQSVSRHMRRNPRAAFVSTEAVTTRLATNAAGFDEYRDRVRTIEPPVGSSTEFSHEGVSVDVLRLSHGGALFTDIVNLGFIVHLGGKRILHVGDGVLDQTTMSALEAAAVDVDVACVPYLWLLSYDGQLLLKKKLKPKKIIALHFARADKDTRGAGVHKYFLDAVLMHDPGQTTPF